ncbi:uncharacterized protein LOC111388618 [Olea europaea var. sylvestris]|uniref:uncharacterized protein LOC111388618 n=1 Tax=Olea europaea var. sylvestris TaxID=158386 RepID=UPI000C1D7D5E|nr:uncharacterized protein LOC111388618 [Olea europaea var. sylvestris]
MFDILFGWRKASKCKKLIRSAQCRLKLLKSKRSCIVKQLRTDVAELLRHGHEKSAFDRVEQLLKDESMVEVYDLIEKFCEFIINNLCYIRKHKDCPNDINEAVSTLIFASARLGDLPELITIRKLFQERYGQRFASAALELHHGNLVNHQIRESISKQNVPDEVKFKLLDEIGRTCVEPGLLLLEYKPELLEESVTTPIGNKLSSSDFQKHNDDNGLEIPVTNIEGMRGKTVYIDLLSEKQTILKSPCDSYKFTAVQNSAHIIEEKLVKSLQHNDMAKFAVSEFTGETNGGGMADESSSETSVRLPEEMIYLDDIEEFVSPLSKDGNCQDQRLFMFKSSAVALKPEIDYAIEANIIPRHDKVSTKSRKTRKAGRKRLRRSVSIENRDVNDVEYASYYGERLSNYKTKSLNRRKHQKKIPVEDKNGRQENENFTCSSEVKSNLSFVKYREKELRCRKTAISKTFTVHSLYEERDEQSHLRAMSMPLERPKENPTENVLRYQSFPIQQSKGSSCYRHIHPKLPDYDELAAKFMALKKANFQPI